MWPPGGAVVVGRIEPTDIADTVYRSYEQCQLRH